MIEPIVLLNAHGKPARVITEVCPRCGADPDKRVASSGFGTPHPVCVCGYEFFDEVYRG